MIRTDYNHCYVFVYMIQLSLDQGNSIQFVDGEIEWGKWITFSELDQLLQVYNK